MHQSLIISHNGQLITSPGSINKLSGQISNPEFVEKDVILNKSKQLIEYVNEAPLYVITEVFKEESLICLSNHLQNWLHVALSDESSIYEVEEHRQQLISFYCELQLFVEALFLFCSRSNFDYAHKKRTTAAEFRLLDHDQIANPMMVITSFYKKFPIAYILRELNDWLESGISYQETYPETMSELQALHTYRSVLCLVKSGSQLLKEL